MFHSDADDRDILRHHDGFDPQDHEDRVARGMLRQGLRQGLLTLALGTLLANALECIHRTHRRRSEGRTGKLPERLQTWEGEGGRPDEPPPAGASASPP